MNLRNGTRQRTSMIWNTNRESYRMWCITQHHSDDLEWLRRSFPLRQTFLLSTSGKHITHRLRCAYRRKENRVDYRQGSAIADITVGDVEVKWPQPAVTIIVHRHMQLNVTCYSHRRKSTTWRRQTKRTCSMTIIKWQVKRNDIGPVKLDVKNTAHAGPD